MAPAPLFFNRRRAFGVVDKPGHPLHGETVEITGRTHTEVHVKHVQLADEYTFKPSEVKQTHTKEDPHGN